MYKGKSHAQGGIPVVVDGNTNVEIEGNEYHICRDAMSSAKIYSFKNKSNKEILDSIYSSEGCKFVQGIANSGDFIVCKLVVLDDAKRTITGTVKSIIDTMQSEKSCNVSEGSNKMEKGGSIEEHKETYQKWKSLVNMSISELKEFYDSQEGKDAGLSDKESNDLGISNGRESARWIMRMKDTSVSNWTPKMWEWANKQISFISRMSGNKGALYDDNGNKTRKHTSLLIWGHNPKKMDNGGEIKDLILSKKIELNFYRTTPDHALEYGVEAENPLYLKNFHVTKTERLKGIGKKMLKYLDDYAIENGNDVIFGHINQKAIFSKSKETNFNDTQLIKNWLHDNGYAVNDDDNNFHKVVGAKMKDGGGIIPQQGTLFTKDKTSKLEYKKVGNDYVFRVYDVENNPVENYTRNQYKKRTDNEASMNYNQFINYLHSELYIDDNTMEKGGNIANSNIELLAPNGNKSNLNHEQWHIVRTPQFKAWFGDWEKLEMAKIKDSAMDEVTLANISKEVSKVVDSNGEPLVVYHFTDKKFSVFKQKGLSKGYFFTENKKDDEFSYNNNPKSYFLSIKKMSEVSEVPNRYWSTPNYENEFVEKSKKGGSNGIQFVREIDNKRIIVAFYSNQIKLADGSNITFDGNKDDIRFDVGGVIENELSIIIKGVTNENKYKGNYKKIFDLIEKDLAFYNPYGTSFEELRDNDFYITITPKPESLIIDKISKLQGVEIVNDDIRYEDGGEVSDRISQIDKEKLTILNEVDPLIREHKKLYGNIDIEMPKSDAEKQSDKKIANLLSRANELVIEKRNLISKSNKFKQGGEIKTALNDIEKAPSVKYWMQPEFPAESYRYEQKGKPDSFVKIYDEKYNADTILAYNKRGNLVGLLTISKGGKEQGAFKIVVREDFMNKGWGKKLLDEAEKQGIDIIGNIKHNSFSYSGRNLLRSWLGNKIGNKMGDGGEIDNLFELVTYTVTIETNSTTDEEYSGFDEEKAIRVFNGLGANDLPTNSINYGGFCSLYKKVDKYKFVYELDKEYDEEISDYPIVEYYEDRKYYKLVEEGEFETIKEKQIVGTNEVESENKNKAIDLLDEVVSIFKKRYPRYVNAGYITKNSHYFLIPIHDTDKTIELRISDHSPNFRNIDANANEILFTELVKIGEEPKKVDRTNENNYDVKALNENFVEYQQIKPKNRVALINCVIYYGKDETYKKFDKNTEYNVIAEYFDLDNYDYDANDVVDKIDELIEDEIYQFEQGKNEVNVFKDGGNIANSNIELLAPNGNKSNLTPKQWHIVRTPAFKQWFGDWEKLAMAKIKDSAMDEVTLANISKEVSKVVDSNGEPLVVYHGTDAIFNEFKKQKKGWETFWFTPNFDTAKMYSLDNFKKETDKNNSRVLQCFLNVRNPNNKYPFDIIKYDGFIDYKTYMDYDIWKQIKTIQVIQVVSSNQIKLADGTNTTFDGDNDDIRYKVGGDIEGNTKQVIEQHLPKGGDIKGITVVQVSENGEELLYGTKSNKTKVSVKGMSESDLMEELEFAKMILSKSKKDADAFNEDEIWAMKGMTREEKLDAIKIHEQSVVNIGRDEKILIPFYEKHLELLNPQNNEEEVLQDLQKYSSPKKYNSEIELGQRYYDNRYGDYYTIEKMTEVISGGDVNATLKYDKGSTRTESGDFILYHIDARQHSLSKEETVETFEPNSPDEFDEIIMANIDPKDDWVGNLMKERDVKQQIYKQLSGDEQEKEAETNRIFYLYAEKNKKNIEPIMKQSLKENTLNVGIKFGDTVIGANGYYKGRIGKVSFVSNDKSRINVELENGGETGDVGADEWSIYVSKDYKGKSLQDLSVGDIYYDNIGGAVRKLEKLPNGRNSRGKDIYQAINLDNNNVISYENNQSIRFDASDYVSKKPKEQSIQERTASFEKTAENFADIRQSLDEFFTPEWIAEIMFKLAIRNGFNGGKIIEPSFGHGVFFDVAKKYNVSEKDMFGFEIYKPNFDFVKAKYPNAHLFDHNFEYQFIDKDIFYKKNKIEKSQAFQQNNFDLVIGNPPYGKHKSPHAYYFDNNLQIRIEGFFIYLGLQKLKKGGLLIYIINSLWLQNADMYNKQKEEIAKIGDLIDAYRLPNKVFKDTGIATDIVIFRKK